MSSVTTVCLLWFCLGLATGVMLTALWRSRPPGERPARAASAAETPEQALARLAVPPGAAERPAARRAG